MNPGRTLPIELSQSEQFCRHLATRHYENFLVASILLPRRMRPPFYNIYAFCRTADDVADESPSTEIAIKGLQELQSRLDAVFTGTLPGESLPESLPESPISRLFPALADTIANYGLSKKPFDDLLSAFRQDQIVKVYETTPQLIDYCTRSANPVGRLVLQMADSLNPTTAELSDQICTGLQLANFWQDVARDHQIGRIYLPGDLRDQFGVTTAMISQASTPAPLRKMLATLCDQAEQYFQSGLPLVHHVPRWLANDIKLFAHGGLATLRAIREINYDVLRVRPKVGKFQQMMLVARAMVGKL